MLLSGVGLHPSALLLMDQRRLHCHVTIDYPHIGWWSSTIVERMHKSRGLSHNCHILLPSSQNFVVAFCFSFNFYSLLYF